ncbi:hypothetical protein AK812_SmicGene36059 [Symbiodinium microadriaticum]|uniref:Uncharacterized protein n=1 Tax=Symbiodinium microadriaticum TaxID=2951 RepID=A0A1Q9CJW0_SYMMI|nr:hypothetical protein AK812_SmicGene36059 [Symbiodinium microadriaticum]
MEFDSFTICPKDRCKSFASFVISVDLHGAYTERALGEASLVRPSAVGACAALADFSTALPPETGIQKAERAWAISSAASLFAWRGLRCRKDRLPRASTIQIEPATDADVRPAAEVAVRSLRWTKGWLDQPKFKDEDYALLAGREVQAYRKLYLTATPYPSTLLVARLRQHLGGSLPWAGQRLRRRRPTRGLTSEDQAALLPKWWVASAAK